MWSRFGLGRLSLVLAVPIAALGASAEGAHARPSTGGWTLVASPQHRGSAAGFAGISCTSPSFCIAVGGVATSRASAPFIARWDGAAWVTMAAAKGTPRGAYLNGVSCTSPTFCVAVGQATTSLVERWDGVSWTIVPSPSPRTGGNVLSSVACRARTWCRAVGESFNTGGQGRTLIEAWDGRRWTLVASPNGTSLSSWLESISCASIRFCEAVGFRAVNERSGHVLQQILAERWDGHRWAVAATPDRPAAYNDLFGVWCSSSRSCVAVGHDETLRHHVTTVHAEIEVWSGRAWTLATAPTTAAAGHSLSGVACWTPHRCAVVGTRRQGRIVRTLVLVLGPAGWAAVASPDRTAGTDNALTGVACPTAHMCLAVGVAAVGRTEQALALRGP